MGSAVTVAYFSLGSNLGDRVSNLEQAVALLESELGPIHARASYYESPSWGYDSPHAFLNTCIGILTNRSPEEILKKIQQIEQKCGRQRTKSTGTSYSDREVDIDLILYGNRPFESDGLIVPHPLFRQRLFVLVPLSEIAPDHIDPVTYLTVQQLLKNCNSKEELHHFITK